MKPNELKSLSDEELSQKEEDLKSEFFNLRFQFFTGQLENTARMKAVRRDIAKVKTIMRERQLQESGDG